MKKIKFSSVRLFSIILSVIFSVAVFSDIASAVEKPYCRDYDEDLYGDPNDCRVTPKSGYIDNNLDCDDGNPGIHPITVPDEVSTIQGAINLAPTIGCNLVLVKAGTYNENIIFAGQGVTVKSLDGKANTTISASSSTLNTVTFNPDSGLSSTLDGFTITNGKSGVYCVNSNPTVKNCDITGNNANSGGGIVTASLASPYILNCDIYSNTATSNGGGFYATGSSFPTIEGCLIDNNISYNGRGGGLALEFSGSAEVIDTTISNNSAKVGGGGVSKVSSSATLNISGSTIQDNYLIVAEPMGTGGGICAINASGITVTESTISGNTAGPINNPLGDGGGIYLSSSTITVTKSEITGNKGVNGGAIYDKNSWFTTINVVMTGNSATAYGGAIYSYGSSPIITNCTINGNSAGTDGGGIAIVRNYGYPEITNSILCGNLPDEVYTAYGYSYPFYYSDICQADRGTPWPWEYPQYHNINADPQFDTSHSCGPYHLLYTSPCIDAGTSDTVTYPSLPTDDIDGESRATNPPHDMGVDEYFSTTTCP